MGWNYKQSADWLNDNGYTTPRGKRFGNAHTHSIVKKKNIREVRITKFYEPELKDVSGSRTTEHLDWRTDCSVG